MNKKKRNRQSLEIESIDFGIVEFHDAHFSYLISW